MYSIKIKINKSEAKATMKERKIENIYFLTGTYILYPNRREENFDHIWFRIVMLISSQLYHIKMYVSYILVLTPKNILSIHKQPRGI